MLPHLALDFFRNRIAESNKLGTSPTKWGDMKLADLEKEQAGHKIAKITDVTEVWKHQARMHKDSLGMSVVLDTNELSMFLEKGVQPSNATMERAGRVVPDIKVTVEELALRRRLCDVLHDCPLSLHPNADFEPFVVYSVTPRQENCVAFPPEMLQFWGSMHPIAFCFACFAFFSFMWVFIGDVPDAHFTQPMYTFFTFLTPAISSRNVCPSGISPFYPWWLDQHPWKGRLDASSSLETNRPPRCCCDRYRGRTTRKISSFI